MPAVVTAAIATASTAATSSVSAACGHAFKPSPLLAPAAVAAFAAYRYKIAIEDRCANMLVAHKLLSSGLIASCKSSIHALPKLSISMSPRGPHQQLHAGFSKEMLFSHLSAASTSLFGDQDGLASSISRLITQRRSLKPPKAYKNDFFTFRYPVLDEKPEWWWRTLACVPYLIGLQLSDVGYYLQPFLEHYDFLGDLIYFIPGAISRLPVWFSMLYIYFAYIGIVKNKEWPHFFRFHLMMGMLLETALQVLWYVSNFMPLIHYNGKFGMHYWAGVGLAYILILLQCIGCALRGGYAHIPFISDAAYIHTLFNIGGYQRPF